MSNLCVQITLQQQQQQQPSLTPLNGVDYMVQLPP